MKVRVFHHDRCFDGACSAAVFSEFFRRRFDPAAEFTYSGLHHRSGPLFDEDLFDGDENAIVDFKYSSSPKLTWWFDHHQSAFLSPEDAEHFARDRSGRKFCDASYKSCTEFIVHIAGEKFDCDVSELKELIHWADIIDGARYESAKAAVEMAHPAMKLTLVFEASDENLTQRIIPLLTTKSFEEIIALPEVGGPFANLFRLHQESIEVIRERAEHRGSVVFFDLSDTEMEGYNKFIPYYLFADSVYTVAVSTGSVRTKVSVGSNPWAPEPPRHNLATICERYGGGGHPRVGAVSYPPGKVERAQRTAQEIVEELSASS